VTSFFHDHAPVDHDEPVGAQNRAQAVGNDQSRAGAEKIFHRLLDQPLTLAVETRCRFVEDHQRGVFEKNSGDGDALALSARELYAALADARIEPVGQALDELDRVRSLGRRANRILARLTTVGPDAGVGDVLLREPQQHPGVGGRRRVQGEVLAALLPYIRDIRRGGSAAVDLCSVAAGRLDAFYERGLNYWDFAAGGLIAREAGALIGGLAGRTESTSMAVAAGPGLYQQLETFLSKLNPERDAQRSQEREA